MKKLIKRQFGGLLNLFKPAPNPNLQLPELHKKIPPRGSWTKMEPLEVDTPYKGNFVDSVLTDRKLDSIYLTKRNAAVEAIKSRMNQDVNWNKKLAKRFGPLAFPLIMGKAAYDIYSNNWGTPSTAVRKERNALQEAKLAKVNLTKFRGYKSGGLIRKHLFGGSSKANRFISSGINNIPEINVNGIDRRWRLSKRGQNHGNGHGVTSEYFYDYYDGGNYYLGDNAVIRGGRTIYTSPKGNDTLYWNNPNDWILYKDGLMPVGGNLPGAKRNFFKNLKRPLVKEQQGGNIERSDNTRVLHIPNNGEAVYEKTPVGYGDFVPFLGTYRAAQRIDKGEPNASYGDLIVNGAMDALGAGMIGSVVKAAGKANRIHKALKSRGFTQITKEPTHWVRTPKYVTTGLGNKLYSWQVPFTETAGKVIPNVDYTNVAMQPLIQTLRVPATAPFK